MERIVKSFELMETKFNFLANRDGKVLSDEINGHINISAGFWRVREGTGS